MRRDKAAYTPDRTQITQLEQSVYTGGLTKEQSVYTGGFTKEQSVYTGGLTKEQREVLTERELLTQQTAQVTAHVTAAGDSMRYAHHSLYRQQAFDRSRSRRQHASTYLRPHTLGVLKASVDRSRSRRQHAISRRQHAHQSRLLALGSGLTLRRDKAAATASRPIPASRIAVSDLSKSCSSIPIKSSIRIESEHLLCSAVPPPSCAINAPAPAFVGALQQL